jgi:hypothetical protein
VQTCERDPSHAHAAVYTLADTSGALPCSTTQGGCCGSCSSWLPAFLPQCRAPGPMTPRCCHGVWRVRSSTPGPHYPLPSALPRAVGPRIWPQISIATSIGRSSPTWGAWSRPLASPRGPPPLGAVSWSSRGTPRASPCRRPMGSRIDCLSAYACPILPSRSRWTPPSMPAPRPWASIPLCQEVWPRSGSQGPGRRPRRMSRPRWGAWDSPVWRTGGMRASAIASEASNTNICGLSTGGWPSRAACVSPRAAGMIRTTSWMCRMGSTPGVWASNSTRIGSGNRRAWPVGWGSRRPGPFF